MANGPSNLQQDNAVTFDLDAEEAEIDLGFEQTQQPAFQFFVADAGCVGSEGGAHDGVVVVMHTPDQIREGLAHEGRRVGQRRDVFANDLGLGIVDLELDPLGLPGQGAQLMQETH